MSKYKKVPNDRTAHKKSVDQSGAPKTATDNQWVSTGLEKPNNHIRRDGPGGENAGK